MLHSQSKINVDRGKAAKTMQEFDDALVAPMFGCRCATDYYRAASAVNYLSRIRVPTLFLNAANDPVCPAHLIRADEFDWGSGAEALGFEAPPIMLAIPEEGG